MANGDASRAETFKRSLFKWMAPGEPKPSPESRAIVAEALGMERSALSDDDEEADSLSLDDFLHLLVRRVVQEEMRVPMKVGGA